MRKLLFIILSLLFCSISYADPGTITSPLKIEEQDGAPSGRPRTLKVTNGTLTDNSDGSFSLSTGGGGGTHDAVTLDVNADTLLSLTAQALGLDTQAANRVLAGPTTGAAAVPTFRALVAGDIPDISASYYKVNQGTPQTILGQVNITYGNPPDPYSAVNLLSGAGDQYTAYTVGTTICLGYWGVANGANVYMTGSVQYDTILAKVAGVNLLIGTFASTPQIKITDTTLLLPGLTSNGFVKTSGGTGLLTVDTNINTLSRSITQNSHGFNVGDVLKFSGGVYAKAAADNSSDAEVVGIVSVKDTNTFTLLYGGYIDTLSGLSAGSVYFLSPTSAGALTTTEPSTIGQISKPILIAISATEGYFFNFRGSEISDGVKSKSFVITNPTSASDAPIWRVPSAITITAIHLLCEGNVVVGQMWEFDSNGVNGSTVDASDITGIVDTNVNDDGSLSNPGIAANNYLGWKTTSVTGTPIRAIITFEYTID